MRYFFIFYIFLFFKCYYFIFFIKVFGYFYQFVEFGDGVFVEYYCWIFKVYGYVGECFVGGFKMSFCEDWNNFF